MVFTLPFTDLVYPYFKISDLFYSYKKSDKKCLDKIDTFIFDFEFLYLKKIISLYESSPLFFDFHLYKDMKENETLCFCFKMYFCFVFLSKDIKMIDFSLTHHPSNMLHGDKSCDKKIQ